MKKNLLNRFQKHFLMLLMGCLFVAANAQTIPQLKGTVKDANGVTLPGITVLVIGHNNLSTLTDGDGVYIIRNVPESSKIEFRFVGMESQTITAPASGVLDVVMKDDALAIDEVVVTGYGTYSKAAYAGAASVVNTKTMTDNPVTSVGTMLQGSAAGVTSTIGSSGQPGATESIRIRGTGSYNASNSPLFVIDGVPVISGDIGAVGTAGTSAMSTINPSDIENISVIKDAAAASLYGSRAANGVIVITTKRGKVGAAQFNVKADFGFSDFATQFRPFLDGDERREFLYDAMIRQYDYRKTDANVKKYSSAKEYADAYIETVAPKPASGWANWYDALLRQGSYNNYEVSVSGATDKFSYFSSLSLRDQEGIQRMQSLSTIQGRLNVNYKATKNFELGAQIMFSNLSQNVGYDGMEYNSPMYGIYHKITSSDAIYNEDGTYNRKLLSNGKYNPVSVLDNDINKQDVTRMFNILSGTYRIIEGLKFTTRLGYDFSVAKATTWADPDGSSDWVTAGSAAKRSQEYKRLTWQNQLQYNQTFNSKHNVDALVGYEIESHYQDYVSGTSRGFINPNKHELSSGATPYSVGGYVSEYRMVSYLAKANYNYENKYYVGGSYRIDGTSRLRPENRWGSFWSASASWRFMQEGFTQSISKVLTDGKIRFSYGVNGTQPASYYAGFNSYGYGYDYNQMSGQVEGSLVSENLVWESSYNMNLGIDVEFINRITATLEVYDRTTKDLIFSSPVSGTTGVTSILSNIGSFRNRGVELEIISNNIMRKDFNWTTSFNISRNWNKVLKLNGETDEIISGRHIMKEGHDIYTTYLVEFADINPENGNARFYKNTPLPGGGVDRTLTEKYSEATRVMGKITTPKVTGGLTNTFRYKWIDLSFLLTYSLGGYSYDNAAQKSREAGTASASAINQIPAYYRNSWQKPGDVAQYEGWIYKNNNNSMTSSSTAHLHSTDHLRLKNFTFGVSLPKEWIQKIGINKIRVFASGINQLTWAKWDQYDPETPIDGIVGYNTPPLKTVTFGIELGF